jgi:hypothetical protein
MSTYAPKVYRGSKKRLRRIRMHGNGSLGLWMFVAIVLFVLFVALPWLVLHPPSDPPGQANELRAR